MKPLLSKFATLIVLLLCFSRVCVLTGQEKKTVEPEYVDQFFLLDPADTLTSLERVIPGSKMKSKGFAKVGSYLVFPGEHSSIRFSQRSLTFVVRLATRDIDPVSVIQFYPLHVQGKERTYQIDTANVFTNRRKGNDDLAVPFSYEKYGEKSYLVRPKNVLTPGEYVLGISTANDGYCFGIDEETR